MKERAVFEAMTESVAGYERDGTIVYVNLAACGVFGRARGELLGRGLWQVLPEGRATALGAAFQRVADEGRPEQLESALASPGRWYAHQVFAADGQLWVVSRDITEQKLTGQRLEILAGASRVFSEAGADLPEIFERIARQVAEALRDLCSIRLLSPDGRRLEAPVGLWDVDPTWRTMLKDTPPPAFDEAIGAEALGSGRSIMMANIDRLVERRGIHSAMAVPLKAGGGIVGVLSVGRRRNGTAAAYSDLDRQLVEDLADRAALLVNQVRTFQLVEAGRQRLKVIGDSLPVLVSLLDRNERYLFVNATYQKWFGEDAGPIVGRSLQEVVGSADYESISPTRRSRCRVGRSRSRCGSVTRWAGPARSRPRTRHTWSMAR